VWCRGCVMVYKWCVCKGMCKWCARVCAYGVRGYVQVVCEGMCKWCVRVRANGMCNWCVGIWAGLGPTKLYKCNVQSSFPDVKNGLGMRIFTIRKLPH